MCRLGEKIKKSIPRLVNPSSYSICYKCAENYIGNEIKLLKEKQKEWKKSVKEHSKEIVLSELK